MTLVARLDQLLARWSMYRLVAGLLGLLAALAVVLAATEVLEPVIFKPGWMIASWAVLLASALSANVVLSRLFRVPAHHDSAVITALLLGFLYWPARDGQGLAWLVLPAVLAIASKLVLAWRGRHLLNPAAAGVLATVAVQELLGVDAVDRLWSTWWVAAEPLAIPVLIAALLVLRRTALLGYAALFVAVALAVAVPSLLRADLSPVDAVRTALTSWPLVFLAGFMLSEPLTLASRRGVRHLAAVVAAVVVSLPLLFSLLGVTPVEPWIFGSWTELSLVAANLIAFVAAPRRSRRLEVLGSRRVGADIHELTLRSAVPIAFRAGQYVELELPHRGADARGVRRWLSLTAAPDAGHLTVATRVPAEATSFKRALAAARPGDRAGLRWVGGDFVLPEADEPVVLVAGGIGITPFLSHLGHRPDRDAVLVWAIGAIGEGEVPFREELEAMGARVVIVAPAPVVLPDGWTLLRADALTADLLGEAVPDLAQRTVFVSGRPAMVAALRRGLRGRARRVHTDVFTGL